MIWGNKESFVREFSRGHLLVAMLDIFHDMRNIGSIVLLPS